MTRCQCQRSASYRRLVWLGGFKTGARHAWDLNPGYHSYEPSALTLSYPIIPRYLAGYLHTPGTELSCYSLRHIPGYLHTPDTGLSCYSPTPTGVPAGYLPTLGTELSRYSPDTYQGICIPLTHSYPAIPRTCTRVPAGYLLGTCIPLTLSYPAISLTPIRVPAGYLHTPDTDLSQRQTSQTLYQNRPNLVSETCRWTEAISLTDEKLMGENLHFTQSNSFV